MNDERKFPAGIDFVGYRLVPFACGHRDFFRTIVSRHGLVEEPLGSSLVCLRRQQKIDRFALLVDSSVRIYPGIFYLDVGFVLSPARASQALILSESFLKQREKRKCSAIDRRAVDKRTAFLHRFIKMPVAQRIFRIPDDAH